ncbi:unnamed protein product [Microthlaspi erraticum]|uniref:Uncharacterized protein n=1 Tax=Microthlaspi erraticum TaxID=1685480 RepID=A0A6D2JQB7_9BRAS|nr:unnamed protein product [Microthlaspi erraticum]CAA7061569.1 unnamed protein product [Microthlaspi erraticum]
MERKRQGTNEPKRISHISREREKVKSNQRGTNQTRVISSEAIRSKDGGAIVEAGGKPDLEHISWAKKKPRGDYSQATLKILTIDLDPLALRSLIYDQIWKNKLSEQQIQFHTWIKKSDWTGQSDRFNREPVSIPVWF